MYSITINNSRIPIILRFWIAFDIISTFPCKANYPIFKSIVFIYNCGTVRTVPTVPDLEPIKGFEPLACSLRNCCSANWAILAQVILIIIIIYYFLWGLSSLFLWETEDGSQPPILAILGQNINKIILIWDRKNRPFCPRLIYSPDMASFLTFILGEATPFIETLISLPISSISINVSKKFPAMVIWFIGLFILPFSISYPWADNE